jgi:hypothetical protein
MSTSESTGSGVLVSHQPRVNERIEVAAGDRTVLIAERNCMWDWLITAEQSGKKVEFVLCDTYRVKDITQWLGELIAKADRFDALKAAL